MLFSKGYFLNEFSNVQQVWFLTSFQHTEGQTGFAVLENFFSPAAVVTCRFKIHTISHKSCLEALWRHQNDTNFLDKILCRDLKATFVTTNGS